VTNTAVAEDARIDIRQNFNKRSYESRMILHHTVRMTADQDGCSVKFEFLIT